MKDMKYHIIFIFIIAQLFSCQNELLDIATEEVKEQLTLADIVRGITSPDRNATISILNYQSNFNPSTWAEYTTVSVSCNEGSDICEADEVTFGPHQFSFGSGYEQYTSPHYKDVFGQTISISFKESGDIDRDFDNMQLYVPEVLSLDVPTNEPILLLQNGVFINWNADPNNPNGVYIIVEYTPFENKPLRDAYPDKEYGYVNVPDNGSYTFSKSDFPEIPDGSLTLLRVARGSFIFPEVDDEPIRVFAVTHVGGYAKF